MYVHTNSPGQMIVKILVSIFLFPIGLLILLWKGVNVSYQPIPIQTFNAAPGWYNDPSGAPGLRYWNGFVWTENVSTH